MRHRGEHMIFQPLTVGEHALLMRAGAEVASLAGIGQQVVMAALIAGDAREPLMQIAAGEETFENLGFYRALDESGGVPLATVMSNTLVQRAHPRVAREIATTCRRLRVPAHRLDASMCPARC